MCATKRGYLFLKKLTDMLPTAELMVFSFREESSEPPFLEDIRSLVLAKGGSFFESKRVDCPHLAQLWETTLLDLMFVVSWRYMIPASVYRLPRLGTYVFHDSLLPEYRGFSPTVWAIINGEDHTGVTLFRIADGVDEGDIVDQERLPIDSHETIATVLDRVTQVYLGLLERNLDRLLSANIILVPQDNNRATYTCKRVPEDNLIDWTLSTERIYNLIRAVTFPYPGAYTYVDGREMRIWSARELRDSKAYVGRVPGRIVEVCPGEGSVVLTGDGSILLEKVQIRGEEIVTAAEVLRKLSMNLGKVGS
jgi:methionyl-tRNA formyltransferase